MLNQIETKNETKNETKKKKTLTFKLVVTMTSIVAGTIILCWILINTFLEKVYERYKYEELISAFNYVEKFYSQGEIDDADFLLEFQKICSNDNLDIIVVEGNTVVLSSTNDRQRLLKKLYEIINGLNSGSVFSEIIKGDNFVITRQNDEQMDEEYLILYGVSGRDGDIYMRTPIRSMKESASITSIFLSFTGIVSLCISFIVIILLSNNISKPIRRLSDISKKMCDLKFETKYTPNKTSSRELDELGNNMNELSQTLETTISELKSANNELLKDIEKKEKIDEMRKEFLSNVSHELKTPLALIQGYAEGLKECVNDDKDSRDFYCEVIMDEADKMNQMVKKLLTLNQLEFGNDFVEMKRFDLCQLVQGVINATQYLIDADGIALVHECDEPVYVWGDEFLIEEVITNYLSNAIHYAKGDKTIKIYYRRTSDAVRVCVFNTGDMIPQEEIEKIWIKFYKVDKARTREYGGNGIGLSIVKAIMDLHHRTCGVTNYENGVEFWAELETNY